MTIYHTYREEEAMTIYHTYREEEAMTLRRLLAVTGTTAALTEEELDEAHDYISYNDWSAQGAAHKKWREPPPRVIHCKARVGWRRRGVPP